MSAVKHVNLGLAFSVISGLADDFSSYWKTVILKSRDCCCLELRHSLLPGAGKNGEHSCREEVRHFRWAQLSGNLEHISDLLPKLPVIQWVLSYNACSENHTILQWLLQWLFTWNRGTRKVPKAFVSVFIVLQLETMRSQHQVLSIQPSSACWKTLCRLPVVHRLRSENGPWDLQKLPPHPVLFLDESGGVFIPHYFAPSPYFTPIKAQC